MSFWLCVSCAVAQAAVLAPCLHHAMGLPLMLPLVALPVFVITLCVSLGIRIVIHRTHRGLQSLLVALGTANFLVLVIFTRMDAGKDIPAMLVPVVLASMLFLVAWLTASGAILLLHIARLLLEIGQRLPGGKRLLFYCCCVLLVAVPIVLHADGRVARSSFAVGGCLIAGLVWVLAKRQACPPPPLPDRTWSGRLSAFIARALGANQRRP